MKFIDKRRHCKVFYDHQWVNVEFNEIRLGDIFRLFEPDGTEVLDDEGKNTWEALGQSFQLNFQDVIYVK